MSTEKYVVRLRPKNQLTLPGAIVKQLDVKLGDRLIVEMDRDHPGRVQVRAVRRSYAGILQGMFGSPEEEAAYVREERAAWGE